MQQLQETSVQSENNKTWFPTKTDFNPLQPHL